ncbi:MAG: CBS domain-containing protein [Acidimicrobiales bacterium]|nr:CBS domain-containing protein [Acidimicrobiales bacterium]HRW38317.1 citrate/2-methylcitrate synthase [Aquihabitans sp.]
MSIDNATEGAVGAVPHRPVVAARSVGDLMSHPVVTVGPGAALADASDAMVVAGVGSVVVVGSGRTDPIGILTERDLVRASAAGADGREATVGEWMTATPDVVASTASVDDALDRLAARGYRHIPVVDAGELVGIVSLRDLMRIASLRHPGEAAVDVPRGLKGVVVTETSVGDVRGEEGFFHYREHSAVELAEQRSLEDVWALLFDGALPDLDGLAAFTEQVAARRALPVGFDRLVDEVAVRAPGTGPLDGLRTVLSAVAAAERFAPSYDLDGPALRADALRLAAVTPTVVAALHRRSLGLAPVAPRSDLAHAANYLWMVNGEVPDPDVARAVEQYLMLTVDHGFNASTFTARVITSTGADVGAAVVGALGALSGPLHGGAPSRALALLDEIGTAERAPAHIRQLVEQGERIMGFGHAVYRTDDPRSVLLRSVAEGLGGERAELAIAVERLIVDTLAELKPGRQLYANVEYYAGVVMEAAGLPPELFTPTFAVSRVIGWCANILEQATDNRIIRPSARYVGPPAPQPVPMR